MKRNLLLCAVATVAIASAQAQVPANAIAGKFSVAADKQVYFSKGNLQYTQSTKTWAFAEHQYDMIGDANVNGSTLADKIDLFGWSGSTATAKWGISTSTVQNDYSGDFVDWGKNIGDGNTWYTLTIDEWNYLRYNRTDARDLAGVARIALNADGTEYANGLILLPDAWTCPEGVTFKSGFSSEFGVQAYADYQTFTLADWQKLEAAGAVFLPASGGRDGSDVDVVQKIGYYWSATPNGSQTANPFYFNSNRSLSGNFSRNFGSAVRLVKDYQETGTGIATPALTPSATDAHKIIRNGQVLIERNGNTYTLTGVEVE